MDRLGEKRKVQARRRQELKRKKRRDVERKKNYAEKYRGKIPLDTERKMILNAEVYKYNRKEEK